MALPKGSACERLLPDGADRWRQLKQILKLILVPKVDALSDETYENRFKLRKSIENNAWRVDNTSKWKSAPYGSQNCSEKCEDHDEIKNLENWNDQQVVGIHINLTVCLFDEIFKFINKKKQQNRGKMFDFDIKIIHIKVKIM